MSKVTIELGGKSEAAVRRLVNELGMSQTEILRRALCVYFVLADEAAKGNRVVLEDPNGAQREIIAP
jgi:hypothetical protein